jgi:hypothetical protein
LPENLSCQEKLEKQIHNFFGAFGMFVADNPTKVFWGSIFVLCLLSLGILKR